MIYVHYHDRLGNNLFQFAFARIVSQLSGAELHCTPLPLFPGTYGHWSLPPRAPTRPLAPFSCEAGKIGEWVIRARHEDVLIHGWPFCACYYEPHRAWLAPLLAPARGPFTAAGDDDRRRLHLIILNVTKRTSEVCVTFSEVDRKRSPRSGM